MNIRIRIIELHCNSKVVEIVQALAKVLCSEESKIIESSIQFWNSWLYNKIEGEKITIVAEEIDNQNFIGVVRFWETPYCNNE